MINKYVSYVTFTLTQFDEWLSTITAIDIHDIDRSFAQIDQGKKIYYECLCVDAIDPLGFVGPANGIGFTMSILLITSGSMEERVSNIVSVYEHLVANRSYGLGDSLACREFLRDRLLVPRPALLVKVPLKIVEPEVEAKTVKEPLIVKMN